MPKIKMIYKFLLEILCQSDQSSAFFISPDLRFSHQLLPSFNLSQHAKNHADYSCCSYDIPDSRISKFNWLGAFLTMPN